MYHLIIAIYVEYGEGVNLPIVGGQALLQTQAYGLGQRLTVLGEHLLGTSMLPLRINNTAQHGRRPVHTHTLFLSLSSSSTHINTTHTPSLALFARSVLLARSLTLSLSLFDPPYTLIHILLTDTSVSLLHTRTHTHTHTHAHTLQTQLFILHTHTHTTHTHTHTHTLYS